jgi:17beta-estradiol 17-dehydrogenase / very-long-chain 3-oxoacyl-CoA reductase
MTEQAPPLAWFFPLLAFVGGVYSASLSLRLLSYLALSLRRPRDLRRRYGAWAVVTGPTSGIGRSVALELARRGINLVLLDLDAANLEETSDMVVSRHGVETKTVVFDLSLVGTPQGNDTSLSVTRVPERLGPMQGPALAMSASLGCCCQATSP